MLNRDILYTIILKYTWLSFQVHSNTFVFGWNSFPFKVTFVKQNYILSKYSILLCTSYVLLLSKKYTFKGILIVYIKILFSFATREFISIQIVD